MATQTLSFDAAESSATLARLRLVFGPDTELTGLAADWGQDTSSYASVGVTVKRTGAAVDIDTGAATTQVHRTSGGSAYGMAVTLPIADAAALLPTDVLEVSAAQGVLAMDNLVTPTPTEDVENAALAAQALDMGPAVIDRAAVRSILRTRLALIGGSDLIVYQAHEKPADGVDTPWAKVLGLEVSDLPRVSRDRAADHAELVVRVQIGVPGEARGWRGMLDSAIGLVRRGLCEQRIPHTGEKAQHHVEMDRARDADDVIEEVARMQTASVEIPGVAHRSAGSGLAVVTETTIGGG